MKKVRPVFSSAIGLLIVLGLMTGCYKPAAPDVTPAPAGDIQTGEEMPDVMATAAANATLAVTPTPTEPASPTTEPAPTPTLTPSPTPEPTTPVPTEPAPAATSPPSEGGTHVVQQGENLFRIALRYGTTVEAIASTNGIANPALIRTGQQLTIPGGTQPSPGATTYVVQAGDNLFRIALRYDMSHVYLAQYNNITNPSNISVGQVLSIPPH